MYIKYVIFVYLIFMSQIVLYFLHSTSVLTFYIDVVLKRSIRERLSREIALLYHNVEQRCLQWYRLSNGRQLDGKIRKACCSSAFENICVLSAILFPLQYVPACSRWRAISHCETGTRGNPWEWRSGVMDGRTEPEQCQWKVCLLVASLSGFFSNKCGCTCSAYGSSVI